MSKYTADNVLASSGEFRQEFEAFVRDKFGKNATVWAQGSDDNVAAVDTYAAYWLFRSSKGDLSDEEFDKFAKFGTDTTQKDSEEYKELNSLAHVYWGRDFDKLTSDEMIYVKSAQEMAAERGVKPEDIEKRHDEDLAREIAEEEKAAKEKDTTKENDSATVTNVFQVTRERPGFYNDGDGHVDIVHKDDSSKNAHIVQQNCVIDERQIVKIYDYLQNNPDFASVRVNKDGGSSGYEGSDKEFNVSFYDKDGKTVKQVKLSKLPEAENAELMNAMTGKPEDIEKRHDEDLAREIAEEEKAAREAAEAEEKAKAAAAELKFKNKDEVYDDFTRLANNEYGDAPKEEIEEFIRNKNAYTKAHPEEKDEIDGHINEVLNSNEWQPYGGSAYVISDSFREQYKALNELMDVSVSEIDNSQDNPTPQKEGTEDEGLTVGVLPGNQGRENPGDNKGSFGIGGTGDNGGDQTDEMEDGERGRLRSAESDMNAHQLDILSYDILRSMNNDKRTVIGELTAEELQDQNKLYLTVRDATANLSSKDNEEFNDKFIDVIATNEQVLEGVPPSVLAKAYVSYTTKLAEKNQEIEKTNDDEKKQQLIAERDEMLAKKGNIAKRIDDLTDMLVADTHEDKDLFFADDTNVSDVYAGYKKMFDVRSADLNANQDENNPDPAIAAQIQKMEKGQSALDEQYGSYLDFYGLQGVTKDNAAALDKRYEEMAKGLAKVELNDETANQVILQNQNGQDVTLGALLSSVKFYDAEGNVQPQFKDKDGNETTEWSPGAKVIEDSKLAQTIAMAKQLYVQHNLTSDEELKPEDMQKVLTEHVPQVLYAVNVKSLIEKGILEKPDQYKDKATIDRNVDAFVQDVVSSERPMEIADHTFTNTRNSIVNQANSYRGVLADRLGVTTNDNVDKTPVLNKVCNNVKPFDPRSEARTVEAVTPNVWRSYASETLQGMASAAIGTARVKGAQLCAIGIAHAALGISTATLMLGASTVIPAALTIKQIYSWRKEQKAQGKPTGFKAFMKDKDMRWTLATTALTEAAVGCMFIPGAQPVAVALGVSALAIGVGRAAKNDYKKLRAAGVSKFKAISAATVGAALKVGTAYLVNKGMTSLFNNYFGDKVEHKEGSTRKETHTEIKETQEMVEGAKKTLESFYKGNPEALQHDLDQVREQLHAMGRDDISPEVFLRNACDAGMNTGVDTVNHVDGGGIVHTHGNNLVMTDSWATQHNVDPNAVHALGGIRGDDGAITITNDALKGFDAVKFNVSVHNEIGSTLNPINGDRLAGHQDGVLGRNAMVDENGTTVRAPEGQGTEFNTYANGDSGYEKITITRTITTPGQDVHTPVDYDAPLVAGMYGIRKGGWIHKMVENVGSLADRILHLGKKQKPKPEPKPDPKPIPVPQPKKKTYVAPITDVKDKLIDEYKIVYGIEPTPAAEIAYKKLVMDEFKADREAGKTKADNLFDYITGRINTYDTVLGKTNKYQKLAINQKDNGAPVHETKAGHEATAMARQDMMQTNLSFNGKDLPRNQMTLQKFTNFAACALGNDGSRGLITAAHDNSTGRSLNDNYNERPHGGTFDVGTGKVSGQTTKKGNAVVDGKTNPIVTKKGMEK